MQIPWKRRGTRAASMHFVKVRGDNASPNGKTRYWYALPPKANLRNLLWHGRMDMWMYASVRAIVTNQSSDLICGTICLKVNILNWSCMSRSELEGLKWDATPHPSLELWNTGCKTWFPCWSEVHILWPLSLTELSLLVPLPEPAGGPPRWKTSPETWAGETQTVLIPFFYSLQHILKACRCLLVISVLFVLK